MSVLGRLLFASAERLDLPDLLSIDSFVAGDFKFLLKGLVGDDKPYVLKGFDVINPGDAIGNQSLSIRVADSAVFYPGSLAGPFYHGLEEGNANAQPLVPDLKKNATNYIYLTFSTFDTARDTRAFWDPDIDGGDGGEFTQDIDTESVLQVDVNVSVSGFPDNVIPIAIVTVGPTVIEDIEDARDDLFRLGTGGVNPDPFAKYSFRDDPTSAYARKEPPNKMSSALDPNAFQGGDKNIQSLKEWMDVVMTKLLELGGTTYWYEDTSSFGMVNIFLDSLGRSLKSKGSWEHSDATPGLLTWTEDIHFKYVSDDRDIIIRAANKTLADEEVLYVQLQRDQDFNTSSVAVEWVNGVDYVDGATAAFENLSKGDWVKKKGDTNNLHYRVEEFFASTALGGGTTSPALAKSIRLSNIYAGASETQLGVYTKGEYDSSEVFVVARSEADALNGNQTLEDLGGDMAWLAIRSDTIMSVADITTTSLIDIDITEADGSTAKVTSVGHGLVDGDRVTIANSVAGYNGTYVVDVIDTDNFYINTADNGDELGVADAFYATVTTEARTIDGGFEVESAQHNFEDNQSIEIANTASSFDDTYQIKVRSATTFTIPVPSAIANVSTGTATLARINVRSEFGMVEIKQGEATGIGEGDTANIMSFIGMASIAETNPTYNLPAGYDALDGMANYNGETTDNLTVRAAKLTAMMADKAQDKTIKLVLDNVDRVTSTLNVTAQDITFTALDGGSRTMHVILPGSANNGSVTLSGIVSLEANQAAYFTIDRNAAFSVASLAALTVADIDSVPIDENVFVFALRDSGSDVWLWDGTLVENGETRPLSSHIDEVTRQDRNIKLVRGGTWSWDLGTNTLSWDADAYVQVPGLAEARNTISAGSTVLASDGDVAHVEINRNTGAVDTLTITVEAISAVDPTLDTLIIARRLGDVVVVGEDGDALVDGESQTLEASSSDQTLTYIGSTGEADDAPAYTSNNYVTDGNSLTQSISDLDSSIGSAAYQDRNVKLIEGGTWFNDGGDLTFDADAYIDVPGLARSRNRIPTTESPITLGADQVAYVDINRDAGPAADLTVSVADIDAVTENIDRVIIARETGAGDIIVGTSSFALEDGERLTLDGALAEINRLLGQLKMTEHETDSFKVRISGADSSLLDSAILSQEISQFIMDFGGAVINFSTGAILEEDDATPLGINFTPFAIPVGEYFWYGIGLVPSGVSANNRQQPQVQVNPASASNVSASVAPLPVIVGDKKLGAIQIFNNAGTLEIAQIRRLGVGSGGGGTGDANELLERLKDQLDESSFEALTPNIFATDEDDLVDSATASFSFVDSAYEFTAGSQTVTSVQMLDDQALSVQEFIDRISLTAFWLLNASEDAVDTAAVYEASLNGGVDWEALTMERVSNTGTYVGSHIFDPATFTDVSIASEAGPADGTIELNATTQSQIAQSFTLTETTVIQELDIDVTKNGTPSGNLYFYLVSDDTALPSTDINDKQSETSNIAANSLVTGGNTISIPRTILTAGTWHVVVRSDQEYKDNFVASTTSIEFDTISTGSGVSDYDEGAGTWADSGIGTIFDLKGYELDLRIRFTSSAANVKLLGYGVFYDEAPGALVPGAKKIHVERFDGIVDNENEFTLPFLADPDLLKVYERGTGQVYTVGDFSINGHTVSFPTDTFNKVGTVVLKFEEMQGSSFDNSDANALLLAANHLGSTDGSIDRSMSGFGILLRSDTGKLVEATIEEVSTGVFDWKFYEHT